MEFLKQIHFYEMHIFKYSKRAGTRAAVMENQIPEEVKTKRSNVLLSLADEMSREFREYYVGKQQEVLFEEVQTIEGKDYYVSYTREDVKVAKESKEALDNCFVEGTIGGTLTDGVYRMR